MKLIAIAAISFFISPVKYRPQPAFTREDDAFSKAYKMINEGQALVKEGDLILRMSQDPRSQFIKNFSRHDKRYSHSGIVLFENGYPYVYHMVSGDENPDGKLKKDSLVHFCAPEKNFSYGIYRYNFNSFEVKQLKQKIYQWQKEGLRFDASFNLQTDTAMYCSEMVKKAIAYATKERINIKSTAVTKRESTILANHFHLSFAERKHFRVIPIDNLYMNLSCTPVKQYQFFD